MSRHLGKISRLSFISLIITPFINPIQGVLFCIVMLLFCSYGRKMTIAVHAP